MDRFLRTVDALISIVGNSAAWLVAVLTVVLSYEVVMRYIFGAPTAWAYDISYMLGGTFFMLGAGYTLMKQKHVRVDVIYNRFSARTQAIIDAVLTLCFFFPVWLGVLWRLFPYVAKSWQTGERSLESFWRPPIYPFKTVMLIGISLLLIAGIAEFVRTLRVVFRGGS